MISITTVIIGLDFVTDPMHSITVVAVNFIRPE